MKKIIIPLAALFTVCLAGTFFLLSGVFADKNVFPKNSTITINTWQHQASGLPPSEVYNTYLAENQKSEFTIHAGSKSCIINLEDDIVHELKPEDIQDLLQECSSFDYLFGKKDFTLTDSLSYDEEALNKKVKKSLKESGYQFTKAINASFDTKRLKVIPEKEGTEIDVTKASRAVVESVREGKTEINLAQKEYYLQPSVTSDDIKEKFADVIAIKKWEASYKVSDYVIRLSDYPGSITVNDDGSYRINTEFLKTAVLKLSKTVDKIGEKRRFKSTKQGTIWVSGGTYGQMMDNEAEIRYLSEMLNQGKKVKNREPEWKIKPPKPGSEDTYIEVDISAQHVWYYKKGKLVMDTPVVTGCSGKKRDTPKGWYFVSEKVNGKYLTGPGYKTWVNKWMRLTNTGIGLHDATWRGSFGGTIYKTNGSHGCINMPYDFAKKLYDEINVGIMVVIV